MSLGTDPILDEQIAEEIKPMSAWETGFWCIVAVVFVALAVFVVDGAIKIVVLFTQGGA